MTQGKIERWHQTLKNRILPEGYFLPGRSRSPDRSLCRRLQPLPLHESIDNLAPADVYFGRVSTILAERERIKPQPLPIAA
jgi:putative transposase